MQSKSSNDELVQIKNRFVLVRVRLQVQCPEAWKWLSIWTHLGVSLSLRNLYEKVYA